MLVSGLVEGTVPVKPFQVVGLVGRFDSGNGGAADGWNHVFCSPIHLAGVKHCERDDGVLGCEEFSRAACESSRAPSVGQRRTLWPVSSYRVWMLGRSLPLASPFVLVVRTHTRPKALSTSMFV